MFDQSIDILASFYLVETCFKGLEGCYGLFRTFPISNLTTEPRFGFLQTDFSQIRSHT